MNQTFYRKYRPKKFKDIVGQDFIKKTLINEILLNKLSHAYIFSGPRGIGKTSIAKIFSRAINCINNNNGDCCNECINCLDALSNNSLDIIELDAASNNGVNEIRNIIENSNFLPSIQNKKVYIIDEAHMLTNQAWNAFLKTLEDPPEHVLFIFATTEPSKIIPTIISRCERFNFNRLNENQVESLLKNVCELENIKYDEDSIKLISLLADGSIRDSLSILSQVSSYSNEIDVQTINKMFGIVDIKRRIELIKLITSKNVNSLLKLIDEFEIDGIDFYKLTYQIIQIIIDLYIFKKTKSINNLKILNSNNVTSINISTNESLKMISIFEKCLMDIKNNGNDKFYFKIACLLSLNLFEFYIEENKENDIVKKNSDYVIEKNTIKNNDIVSNELNKQENIKTQNNITLDTTMTTVKLDDIVSTFKYNDNQSSYEKANDFCDKLDQNENKDELLTTDNKKFETDKNKLRKVQDFQLINFDKIFKYEEIQIDKPKEKQKNRTAKNNHSNEQISLFNNLVTDDYINNQPIISSDETIKQVEKKEENKLAQDVKEEKIDDASKEKLKETILENIILDQERQTNFDQEDIKQDIKNDKITQFEQIFFQIADNKDNDIKENLSKIFDEIKTSIPKQPEEGYISDALKIILASKNGIVFLFEDEYSSKTLNKVSEDKKFIEFIYNKFNSIYKVIGLSKKEISKLTETYKELKLENKKFDDVDISNIKSSLNINKDIKNIALEIFKEELQGE